MHSASVEKQVKELQNMAQCLDNGFKRQALLVRRAIRMLQDQQAQLSLSKKQPIDVRLCKIEDNERMSKVGRAYLKIKKSMKMQNDCVFDDFHGRVNTLIAKN